MNGNDRKRVLALALTLLGTAPGMGPEGGPLAAQEAAGPPSMTCWRGQPLPRCRGFFLVEAQGSLPLVSDTRIRTFSDGVPFEQDVFEAQLDWNVGYMVNVDDRWAVGGMITVGTGSREALTGLRGRVRRWLRPDLSAEFGGGAVLTDGNSAYALHPFWGATADARLNIGDHGSFFLRWDGVDLPETTAPSGHYESGGFSQALYIGAGAGSTWAVVSTGIGFAILMVIFSTADFA